MVNGAKQSTSSLVVVGTWQNNQATFEWDNTTSQMLVTGLVGNYDAADEGRIYVQNRNTRAQTGSRKIATK